MLPDFLCIGAQKAGTSWLYLNIKRHPGVWIPPIKEIHHFDDPSSFPKITWLFLPEKRYRRRNVWLVTRSLPRNVHRIRWFWRYLLSPRDDQWYASLFSPDGGQIAGDITPGYARLEKNRVARIHSLMPGAKIIYSLRNPIHRMWSQAAMYFTDWGKQPLDSIEPRRIKSFLDKEQNARNSDYLRTLQIWEKFYPSHRFHVCFFDQLVTSPRDFLKDIYRFLELDASEQFIPRTVHKKRNVGQYPAMPDHVAHYLANQYRRQIKQLHRQFDNDYTAEWLDFAERHL